MIFGDVHSDTRYLALSHSKALQKSGFSFFAVFPIRVKDKSGGSILFISEYPRQLTSEETRLLTSIASQIGVAVEKANLFQETVSRAKELSALYDITATVNQSLEVKPVLQGVIEKMTEIFHFATMRIYLFNASMDELYLMASYPPNRPDAPRVSVFKKGQGIVGKVAQLGEPLIFEDALSDPRYRELSHTKNTQQSGFRFFAAFPIKARFKSVGTIVCNSRVPRRLAADEIELITSLTNEIGVAIHNANLFAEVKEKSIELEEANRELVQANRAKSEFMAAVSHELRTPLNVVIGNADLIKEGVFGHITEQQNYALEKILRYSRVLLKLINDVLTFTRIDAKKMSLDISTFSPEEVIGEVRTYAEQLNHGNRIKVSWDVEEKLPRITTDALKLEEILQNLIGNAFKFTPKGQIDIRVRDLKSDKRIEFSVRDTGIGIEESELKRVFEDFYQLSEAHTGTYGGVGLGLTIVKRYLDLMRGEIQVSSQPLRGSTFTFSLPYSCDEESISLRSR